ncbi:DUF6215 domain-containing protein [Streptomyces sp. NPDC001941]|uniref:DUF6215 domain-containing protein n=1 Tax=Streptomyces sp. NPDC001941 TaxID=3154659 RepID=UPI00331FC9C8
MTDEKGAPSPWAQAVLALALVGALGVGLLYLGQQDKSRQDDAARQPAACDHGDREEEVPAGHVSGTKLCDALNRADLAQLLGTPVEKPKSAYGSSHSSKKGDGRKVDTSQARVEFDTYTVTVEASYDRVPVSALAPLLGTESTVHRFLGHPAFTYADRTISISFQPGKSTGRTGSGVPARTLAVALDPKDTGGSLTMSVWRSDGVAPEEAVLLGLAEKVLPSVPGFTRAAG